MQVKKGDQVISESSVFLDLKNIKDMYERATLDDGTDEPLSLVNPNDPQNNTVPTDPNEAHQIVVFVHGWNMSQWEWKNFSETMFKRLWYQGYKGRFATLRWPTKTDAFSYNTSEFIAFKSGLGVSRYLNKLRDCFPSYSVNVAAHSMGNIVMGQALKEQLAGGFTVVNNYVAMQGAVPAQCYDVNAPTLEMLVTKEQINPTPNTYTSYMGTVRSAITGNIVNFYNPDDFALVGGTVLGINTNWQDNQRDTKPDTGFGYGAECNHCMVAKPWWRWK